MGDELVHYPFKIDREEDLLLYRVGEDFEMRFTKELCAKRTLSSCKRDSKKYIEIEVSEDGNAKIVQVFDQVHVFKTPADFYVPVNEDAKYFYESLHLSLVNENLDVLLEKAKEVDELVKKSGFPDFPIPITSVSTHFENFESATSKPDDQFIVPTIQVKYTEDVPNEPLYESINMARKYLTSEQFIAQNEFFQSFFKVHHISRFKTVARTYEEKDVEFKRIISLNFLKKCIGIHGYFLTSGPWRKCWVRFGYDPKSDNENYKYQIIEMRSKKINFQIFQKLEVVTEVSKNRDWYLLKECDPIDGFISKALKNFIVYIIDNGEAKLIDKKIEDLQDSDMDIFEM